MMINSGRIIVTNRRVLIQQIPKENSFSLYDQCML